MRGTNRLFWVAAAATVVTLVLGAGNVAMAKGKGKAAAQVEPVMTLEPGTGFVDDAFAFDGAGGRVAVAISDAAALCQIKIIDVVQARELATLDVSKVTTHPVELAFVLEGDTLFVKAAAKGDRHEAFLVDLSGKVLRRFGVADDLALASVDGVPVVVSFSKQVAKSGTTTYDVSAVRLDNGKRVGKRQRLVADKEGMIKKLDMIVLYWQEAYTVLVVRKKGGYDEYKDRRMPDSEARYDVLEGAVLRTREPEDVIEYTKVLKLHETRNNQASFVLISEDHTRLERIGEDDARTQIQLAEPLHHYEPASLIQDLRPDGSIYFSLTIDPVNPDAVARKKADPELIDLYVLAKGAQKAKRLARVLKDAHPIAWRAAGQHWALLRKHRGFDRGGAKLELFKTAAP